MLLLTYLDEQSADGEIVVAVWIEISGELVLVLVVVWSREAMLMLLLVLSSVTMMLVLLLLLMMMMVGRVRHGDYLAAGVHEHSGGAIEAVDVVSGDDVLVLLPVVAHQRIRLDLALEAHVVADELIKLVSVKLHLRSD